jgi:hypothetical protein
MSLRASELQTAVASKSIDAVNREADRIRQERHQHCEPDLEYIHAEFEKLCRSEIAATIAAAIPSTKQRP